MKSLETQSVMLARRDAVLCIPPMAMALAFGVAPPSLSSSPLAAPGPDGCVGDERKNRGDCVEVV